MTSAENEKSVLELLEEGEREAVGKGDVATEPSSDVQKIRATFARVMQKVKQAYHKELQRKKQVDLTASVDIMRSKVNEDINENENNEEDEAVQAMTKEIEVTRRLLEVSLLREEQSKQTIAQLESDVTKLQKLVEEEEALRKNEGLTLHQLISLKRQLTSENDKLTSENQVYSQQFILLQMELTEATADKRRLDLRLGHLQKELMDLKDELEAETKACAKVRDERDAIQDDFDAREEEIVELARELDSIRVKNAEISASQADLEAKNKKLEQTAVSFSTRYDVLTQEFEATKKMLIAMDDENVQLGDQLRASNGKIQEGLKEIQELEKIQKKAFSQIEHYENECRRAESERELLEGQLEKLEKELNQVRLVAAGERQGNDKILREHRMLHIQLHEHLIARERQGDVWCIQHDTIRKLEAAIREEDNRGARLRGMVFEADQQIHRLIAENERLRQELHSATDKANVKDAEIARLKENRSDLEKRMQQIQSMEDSVKQAKSLLDLEMAKIKEEKNEQDRRLKTLSYMVEKLKEELSTKEALVMQGKRVKQQLESDLNVMRRQIEDHKKTENERKITMAHNEKELQKLQLLLQQASEETKRAVSQVESEKASCFNYEQRYVAQKSQVEELRNKLRDQERQIQEEAVTSKRLETELQLYRIELERTDQEKKGLANKFQQLNTYQKDYENLRETLLHEQVRRSALEAEKRKPVLVHPWRILQATDPATYVTMMREQAAKRNKIRQHGLNSNRGRTKLPDIMLKRPLSSYAKRTENNELQTALMKAIL